MIVDPLPASIGTAHMLADGTLVLDLVARGHGMAGDARFVYRIGSPDYDDVLDHLGGLVPGETKSVPPWPDQSSDSVEQT